MEQELKVLGKFLYSHFLCFFDSKADLLTSVTTSAQGNPSGYGEKVVLGMGYLLATHCCPDKLALNGPKSLTHDVRF